MFIALDCILRNTQDRFILFIAENEVLSLDFFSFGMQRPKLWRNSDRIFYDEQVILLVCVHSILNSHVANVENDNVVVSFDVVELLNVILVADKGLSDIVNISVSKSIDEIQHRITQLTRLNSEMRVDQKLSVCVGFIDCFQNVGSSLMNFILKKLAFGSLLDEGQEETEYNKNTGTDFDHKLKTGC